MKRWCCIVPIVFASACTTLEDFQAMSPDERAEKVCGGTDAARQRKRTLSNLNSEISEKEELLATGYRVHEYCQIVAVSVPARPADCGGLTGDELNACQKGTVPATMENRRVCRETAVPIDYNYETAILRDLRMTRETEQEFHDQQTYVCVAKARSLPVDEAYLRYKANAEP